MGIATISHSDTSLCQALTDLLQTIALESAALANILNAEGEKLQRALQISSLTVNEILAVNQSVLTTIEHVGDLEGVLLAKLDKIEIVNANTGLIIRQKEDV